MVPQHIGKTGNATDALVSGVKFRNQFRHLSGHTVLFLLFLLLGNGFVSEKHLVNLHLLLAPAELRIGLSIEEHDINVSFGPPTAVAAVAVLVAFPGHGLSAKGPAETAVGIAAAGKVGDGSVFDADHGDILVVPAAVGHPIGQEITAVRTPGKLLVPIGIGIVHALVQGFGLSALRAQHHQFRAIPEIGDPFAVRRHLHLEGSLPFRAHTFFLHGNGIGEILVFLAGQRGPVNAPATVPFRSIIKRPAVFRETDPALLLRRIGDTAGGGIIDRGDENVSPDDDRHLLSVGRHRQSRGIFEVQTFDFFFFLITEKVDCQFLSADIQITVVGIGQCPVGRYGKKADRILLIKSDLGLPLRVGKAAPEHVGGFSVLFAQEIKSIPVGRENRIPVLADEGGEFLETAFRSHLSGHGRPIKPDVTGDGRGMVLSERVFIAFVILVQHIALRVDAESAHREGGDQLGCLSLQIGPVELLRAGETVKTGALDIGVIPGEPDIPLPVRGQERLIPRKVGEAFGNAPFRRCHIDVPAVFPPGSEHNPFPVRSPQRIRIKGGIAGYLKGVSPGGRDGVKVSLITENDSFTIRRNRIFPNPGGVFLRGGGHGQQNRQGKKA